MSASTNSRESTSPAMNEELTQLGLIADMFRVDADACDKLRRMTGTPESPKPTVVALHPVF